MKRNTIAAILMLIFIAFGASASNAQFGGLMKKAQDKIDKSNKKVDEKSNQTTNQTTGGNNTGAANFGDEGARWDLFKCNPKYVGAVDENRLREIVQYNVNGDMGKGGVIVFTKQPLTKENPTFADSVMTFKGGDPIYMTVVFAKAKELDGYGADIATSGDPIITVGDYQKQCQDGRFKNTIYVNYGRFDKIVPKILKLDFQPADGKSAKYQQQIKSIAETLRQLNPGVHLVPIRISANDGETTAVGAFYYDNRDGNGSNAAIEAGLKEVKMPASSGKFAELEKQILALGKGTYLRVVVTDNEWTPLRHEVTGVLIGRAISATTAMKNQNGTCYRETQTWVQNYDGKNYTNLHLDGFRDDIDMACENATK